MKWKILRGEVAAMTDTASSTHSRTVQLNRQVLELRHQADALKSRAIDLRRQAKSALLSSDAFAMRHEAKQKMSEASDLKATAKKLEKELLGALKESAALLSKRLPVEYSSWGIQKTRAYLRVLAVLQTQTARDKINTALATEAITVLLSHPRWTEAAISGYSVLKPSARALG